VTSLPPAGDEPDVGAFRAGSAASRWALSRYLVGRALAESVGRTLFGAAVVLLVGAVALQEAAHLTALAVLVGLVAVAVLLLSAGLRAVLRRLTGAGLGEAVAVRLRRLVGETRRDVRRELRRLGLPSHAVTMPLLALRLAGRRRADTLQRLRGFELARVVPPARLDELHLVVRGAVGAPGGLRPDAAAGRNRP
jgi:hypothetical protein